MTLRLATPLEQVVAQLKDERYVQDVVELVQPIAESILGTRMAAVLLPEIQLCSKLLYSLVQVRRPPGTALQLPHASTLGEHSLGILRARILHPAAGPGALAFVGMATQSLSSVIEALVSYGEQRMSAGWTVVRQTINNVSTEVQHLPANAEESCVPEGTSDAAMSSSNPLGLRQFFSAIWWLRVVGRVRMMCNAAWRALAAMCQNFVVPLVRDTVTIISPWLATLTTPPASTCISAATLGYTAYAYLTSATVNPSAAVLQMVEVTAKRASNEDLQSLTTFRFIGVLLAAQATLLLLKAAAAAWSARNLDVGMPQGLQTTARETELNAGPQCALCLQPRNDASTTVCGHVFCWRCIMEATMTKPECPVCRQPCLPQELVRLQNYV